jgi:cysteine-rich repeat protein
MRSSAVAFLAALLAGCAAGGSAREVGDSTGGSSSDGAGVESTAGPESEAEADTADPADDDDSGEDACPHGQADCPCALGEACVDDLVCDEGTCVERGTCGNEIVEPGETCDLGTDNVDTGVCKSDCTLAVCGDGVLGPVEACDDGNQIPHDGCTNECALPECGDGEQQDGEPCDDGNFVEDDACLMMCIPASCGDMHVWRGVEECDDDADVHNDCVDCHTAYCGDGYVWYDQEECDGIDLDGQNCLSLGFLAGTLACTMECSFDTSGCS